MKLKSTFNNEDFVSNETIIDLGDTGKKEEFNTISF